MRLFGQGGFYITSLYKAEGLFIGLFFLEDVIMSLFQRFVFVEVAFLFCYVIWFIRGWLWLVFVGVWIVF